jgi:hypothetical protein
MTIEIIKSLNENELKALKAICADCDEIDGYGFDRPKDMKLALLDAFNGNGHVVGGYMNDLCDKGLIDVDIPENEVWVDKEIFAEFR